MINQSTDFTSKGIYYQLNEVETIMRMRKSKLLSSL